MAITKVENRKEDQLMVLMKRKNTVIIIGSIILILILSYLVGTGLQKKNDVALLSYSVSKDGTELMFRAHVMSSMGYTRGFINSGGGVKPHYLTFYSTFGGLNSPLGAQKEFVLPLGEEDTEIYFNRTGGGYELVLIKNEETGVWERP